MSKKALNKDLFREIKNTRARFLSIFVLVTLAVAFLSGLRSTEPDMTHTADVYLDAQNLMDVRLVSTLGLTQADVDAAAALEGVTAAEGAWNLDALLTEEDAELVVKVLSLTEADINQPYLLDGRLPQSAQECLVEQRVLDETGKSIGDTITLDTGTGSFENSLNGTQYTIVGLCQSPLYLSLQRGTSTLGAGTVSAFVILPQDAFALDYYTDAYLTLDGALELNAYNDSYEELVDAFIDDTEAFADTRAALRSDTLRSDAQAELDDAKAEFDEAKADADKQLSDAQQELDDARKELDDGWAELADGKEELTTQTADAQAQIEDAEAELKSAYAQLVSGEADYKDGKAQLDAGLAEYHSGYAQWEEGNAAYEAQLAQWQTSQDAYDSGLAQYEAGLAQYEAGLAQWQAAWDQITAAGMEDTEAGQLLTVQKAQLDATAQILAESKGELDAAQAQLEPAKAQLDAAKATLDATYAQLDSAWDTLAAARSQVTAARRQLDSGWSEYYDGQDQLEEAKETLETESADGAQKLADAEQELTDGEAEYADGLEEYQTARADAQQEIADAQAKLDDAQQEIDDIEDCTWYVLDRGTNLGFASYQQDAEHMGRLGDIFPLIFFLVAALVCLTTMTRMVEEQRSTIGGLKALGYSKLDIARKYVGYGLLASLSGSIVGLLVGCTVIPYIIITCWQIMYLIPDVQFAFCPAIYLVSGGAAVALTVLSVLAAALAALRATPASLMRPKSPRPGKRVLLERITPLWRWLSFTQKVTVRNLFRYKKRFWMTVIGIGGCTALVITGFGMRDSINAIMGIQYEQISHYSATAAITEGKEDDLTALLDGMPEQVSSYLTCTEDSVDFVGSSTISGYYMVLDEPDDLEGFHELRTRNGHQPVAMSQDGVLVTEKLSELLSLHTGDTLTLDDGDQRVEVTVGGIVENYVGHYVYMTQDYYQSLYGELAEHNTAFIIYTDDTDEVSDLVSSTLLADGCVTGINHIQAQRDSIQDSFASIDYAVLIIIIAAAALAFVVLFNLSNINITERMRELATLKVLGFNDREMNAYVLRENIILTCFGVLLGMGMGKALHLWLIRTVEVEMVMFGRSARPISYLWAVLLTFLFSAIVNLFAGRKLRKIDMVESLKTVE